MACPLLREGKARYCHAAPVRKLILSGPGATNGGLCDSPQYRSCELAAKDAEALDRCPGLEEIRVQYCGVSPVPQFIPFSDSQLSGCTSDNYRYCDSYLHLSQPHVTKPPATLLYSPNHFWLDAEESGLCHIGVDAFVADIAGQVDGVTFVTARGTHCPALALTINGVEWPMSFPNPMMIQRVNGRLRSDPARLTLDPYGTGWLFEGWEVPGRTRTGLLRSPQADLWQANERERLNQEIHDRHAPGCDGGTPVKGVAQLLERQHLVCLFQHFFSRTDWTAEK